ncbi:catalase family peroxidase [Rheinheimera sp. F8]|uniref:catalase family peroxidase n=1 Tax=Rheinheimera sp. F8 TaxID=1763998 RepID=UPI000744AB3C|nr:catalase family peroxidase [Rheinheimera sp. F8]ALZ74877.1 catalase [Rheinheimera sp. F8]
MPQVKPRLRPLIVAMLLSLALPVSAESATAPEFIDTFAKIFGEHPGVRKGHAKGFCVAGDFQGAAAIQPYSKSVLFSGDTYPLLGRFSMAGGNPKAAENSRSPRGLALQIKLKNGELQHFALLSTPMFGAKDPESFLGLLKTLIPGPDGKPDLAKVAAYRAAHPDTQPQAKFLASTPPPASYANTPYFGLHSFMLTNQNDQQQAVRWQLQPVDGVKGLTAAEIAAKPSEFLQQRLAKQLQQGPVQFKLQLVLAEAGDNLLDPSVQWPASRKTLDAGLVTLRSQGDNACDQVNFDPNVLSSGISPSADPILAMRSAAYAISFGKRLTGH